VGAIIAIALLPSLRLHVNRLHSPPFKLLSLKLLLLLQLIVANSSLMLIALLLSSLLNSLLGAPVSALQVYIQTISRYLLTFITDTLFYPPAPNVAPAPSPPPPPSPLSPLPNHMDTSEGKYDIVGPDGMYFITVLYVYLYIFI